MTSEISVLKEKADLLKGKLSYREHYGYLMDWYLRDRKLDIPEPLMKESLRDVLEALKELNAKIEGGYKEARKRGNLFTKFVGNA
jgi:hypothetical protein